MNEFVIAILQGSARLGGLAIRLPVSNLLRCMSAKNYEHWLVVDKVSK